MRFSPRILLTLIALLSVAGGCSDPTQPESVRTPPAPVVPTTPAPVVPANPVVTDSAAMFKSLEWYCPMGCSLSVKNFRDYVPNGRAIRVFVGSSKAGAWAEVKPEGTAGGACYGYAIYHKDLAIFAEDESGVADVKITF